MENKITSKNLEKSMDLLLSAFNKKNEEKLKDLITFFKENYNNNYTPEDYYFYGLYDIQEAFHLSIQSYCKVNMKGSYLSEIYFSYRFVESILTKIMTDLEGWICSADRSRWLINSYTTYLKTGKMFNMKRPKNCYWIPRIGKVKQWFDFIESVIELRWGNYSKFLMSLKSLFDMKKEIKVKE